jgi:hypothetical protein
VEGVQLAYIDRRIAGMRGDAATDAKHARLAAAVLLDMVVCDASCVHNLEDAWGQPNCLTKAGAAYTKTMKIPCFEPKLGSLQARFYTLP